MIVGMLTLGPVSRLAGGSPARRIGLVIALAGSVTVTRLTGSVQPLKLADELYWGDVVEAHEDGLARIRLESKVGLTVRPFSRLQVREEQRMTGLRYTLQLLLSTLGASTVRALPRQGDRSRTYPRNTPASVRG